jgi:hypothetical protein
VPQQTKLRNSKFFLQAPYRKEIDQRVLSPFLLPFLQKRMKMKRTTNLEEKGRSGRSIPFRDKLQMLVDRYNTLLLPAPNIAPSPSQNILQYTPPNSHNFLTV